MTEFWTLDADGREYGPVSLETLRAWVQEGRVRPDTRVRGPHDTVRDAADIPELAGAFGRPPLLGPPPVAEPQRTPAQLPARLSILGPYAEAFRILGLDDWLLLSVVGFVFFAVLSVPVVGWVLSGPLLVGAYRVCLARIDGAAIEIGLLFRDFERFWETFLLGLIYALLYTAGISLCVIPGWIVANLLGWSFPIMATQETTFGDAMRHSIAMTRGHRVALFVMLFVNAVVLVVGLLLCCVGVFPAVGFALVADSIAFRFCQREYNRRMTGLAVPPS